MKSDGTILIEQGPAYISALNDRYLEVIYAEAQTADEDEAVLYSASSSSTQLGENLNPDYGDTFFPVTFRYTTWKKNSLYRILT